MSSTLSESVYEGSDLLEGRRIFINVSQMSECILEGWVLILGARKAMYST